MAGEENNATVLAALNQQIAAINDLITQIAGLAFNITCAPDVRLACPSPTVIVQTSPGTPGGTTLPTTPGTQGGTPPSGFEDVPEEAPEDRKCRVANMIFDHVSGTITQLDLYNADQYAGLGLAITTSLVGATLGSVVPGLGTLLGGVAGALVGIAVYILSNGLALDFGDMKTIWDAAQEDLICLLYQSTAAADCRTDVLDLLQTGGATTVELGMYGLLLLDELLNLLYFTTDALEATIEAYPVTQSCLCGGTDIATIAYGTLISGSLVEGGTAVIEAEVVQVFGSEHRDVVELHSVGGACLTYTITLNQAGSDTQYNHNWLDCADDSGGDGWASEAGITGNYKNINVIGSGNYPAVHWRVSVHVVTAA